MPAAGLPMSPYVARNGPKIAPEGVNPGYFRPLLRPAAINPPAFAGVARRGGQTPESRACWGIRGIRGVRPARTLPRSPSREALT